MEPGERVMVLFEVLSVWLAVVVVSGLIVAYLARRWGRDPFGWLILAAAMGPIAIVALIGTRQSDVQRATMRRSGSSASAAAGPRVLIASDGSAAGPACASFVARAHGDAGDVIVLAVLPHEARPGRAERSQLDYDQRVSANTDATVDTLTAAGFAPRRVVVFGATGEEIVRAADAEAADLIVVGRRGRGMSKAIFGSTSDYVLKNATRPVTVVS